VVGLLVAGEESAEGKHKRLGSRLNDDFWCELTCPGMAGGLVSGVDGDTSPEHLEESCSRSCTPRQVLRVRGVGAIIGTTDMSLVGFSGWLLSRFARLCSVEERAATSRRKRVRLSTAS